MWRTRTGFSLVELSIVLVILGLLVGGILSGKSLIRASELRSITTQQGQISTAVKAFKDKYFQLPGDFNNAISFWGAANAAPASCVVTPSSDKRTCNGNGDGVIYPIAYDPGGGAPWVPYEGARFWQHLANADLIEGQYSGLPTTYISGAGKDSGTGLTISLPGKIQGSYWATYNISAVGFGYSFNGETGNALILGAPGSIPSFSMAGIMTPTEVWNIDTKMDDGKPGTGKVVVYAPSGLNQCTDTNNAATLTANYLLTSDAIACGITFRQQF